MGARHVGAREGKGKPWRWVGGAAHRMGGKGGRGRCAGLGGKGGRGREGQGGGEGALGKQSTGMVLRRERRELVSGMGTGEKPQSLAARVVHCRFPSYRVGAKWHTQALRIMASRSSSLS